MSQPSPASLVLSATALLTGQAQGPPLPFEQPWWPKGFHWQAGVYPASAPVLAWVRGHPIPPSCDSRKDPATTGAAKQE